MSRVSWTPEAKLDLREIRKVIQPTSKLYATRFVKRIRQAVDSLKRFPESGGMLPEHERPDLRQVFVADYRIIYRLIGNEVHVLRVYHGARKLPPSMMRD